MENLHVKPFNMDKYYVKSTDDDYLKSLGFRMIVSNEMKIWEYSFVVSMYREFPTLKCILYILPDDKNVVVNVSDMLGRTWSPFYYQEYGCADPLVSSVNENIRKEFKKLDIRKHIKHKKIVRK